MFRALRICVPSPKSNKPSFYYFNIVYDHARSFLNCVGEYQRLLNLLKFSNPSGWNPLKFLKGAILILLFPLDTVAVLLSSLLNCTTPLSLLFSYRLIELSNLIAHLFSQPHFALVMGKTFELLIRSPNSNIDIRNSFISLCSRHTSVAK